MCVGGKNYASFLKVRYAGRKSWLQLLILACISSQLVLFREIICTHTHTHKGPIISLKRCCGTSFRSSDILINAITYQCKYYMQFNISYLSRYRARARAHTQTYQANRFAQYCHEQRVGYHQSGKSDSEVITVFN